MAHIFCASDQMINAIQSEECALTYSMWHIVQWILVLLEETLHLLLMIQGENLSIPEGVGREPCEEEVEPGCL